MTPAAQRARGWQTEAAGKAAYYEAFSHRALSDDYLEPVGGSLLKRLRNWGELSPTEKSVWHSVAGAARAASQPSDTPAEREADLERALRKLIDRVEALIGDTGQQPIDAALDAADEARALLTEATP